MGEVDSNGLYDWAGQFSEGVAVVGLLKTVTYDEGTEFESTADYYELYLLSENGTAKQLVRDDPWSGASPMEYEAEPIVGTTIESAGYTWFCQNGVLNVNGTPFDTDGNEIKVKGALDDQDIDYYEMTGPCVGGVIPMYGGSAVEDGGQAFYMDKNGNITRKFPRYSESHITRSMRRSRTALSPARAATMKTGNGSAALVRWT